MKPDLQTVASICTILVLSGCASVRPAGEKGEPTIFQVSDSTYEMAILGSGGADETLFAEEVSNHAPGVCGTDDFEWHITDIGQRETMRDAEGTYVMIFEEVVSLEINCGVSDPALPRVLTGASQAPVGASVLTIANTTGFLYSQETGAIYVEIDGRPVTRIGRKQYARISLPPAPYHLRLYHIDVFTFDTEFEIEVNASEEIVRVWASPFQTKYESVAELPEGLASYVIVRPDGS